jgi:hypothetical protein
VIKDRVAVIVFNNKEEEKIGCGHQGEDCMCRIFRNGKAEGV